MYVEQGDYWFLHQRFLQAHAEYLTAIRKDEGQPGPYVAISYACRMLGKTEWTAGHVDAASGSYREAHAWLARLLAIDPENVEAYHLDGLLHFDAGRFERAIQSFDRALSRDSSHKYANLYRVLALIQDAARARDCAKACAEGRIDERVEFERLAARRLCEASIACEPCLAAWGSTPPETAPHSSEVQELCSTLKSKQGIAGIEELLTLASRIPGGLPAFAPSGVQNLGMDTMPAMNPCDLPPPLRPRMLEAKSD